MSEENAAPQQSAADADATLVTVISNLVSGQPNEPADLSHMRTSDEEDILDWSEGDDESDWTDDAAEDAAHIPVGAHLGPNDAGIPIWENDDGWDEGSEDEEWEQADEDIDFEDNDQQGDEDLEQEAAEAAADLENGHVAEHDDDAPQADGVQEYLQALWEAEHIPGESDGPEDDENWILEQDEEDEEEFSGEEDWDDEDFSDYEDDIEDMDEGIADLHQNLFDLEYAILPAGSTALQASFWSNVTNQQPQEPHPQPEEGSEGGSQETFLNSRPGSAPRWHSLNAASNHFQAADSISCGGTPSTSQQSGSQAEEILMLHKGNHLALWRLPAVAQAAPRASSVEAAPPRRRSQSSSGASTSAQPIQRTSPSHDRSSRLQAQAQLPAQLPVQLPADDAAAAEGAPAGSDAADPQLLASALLRYKAYSVTRSPDGRLVAAGGYGGFVSLYEVVPNQSFQEPWPCRTYQPCSAANLKKASKHTRQDANPHETPLHPPEAPLQTPLLLQLISHIAVEENGGIVLARCMANSVRFGLLGQQTRLLVAAQTGHVFVFDTEGVSAETGLQKLSCQRLDASAAAGHDPPSMPILCMTDEQLTQMRTLAATHTSDASWDACSSKAITAVIGHFGHPINCAEASPNGQWVAVVGDAPKVWVVSAKDGFELVPGKSKTLHFKAKMPMRARQETSWQTVSPGGQYCSWNCDGSLLAVSSDCYRAVMIFNVHQSQQVLRFEDHPTPCLAVAFAPWDPQLLVFCEDRQRVYVTDLRYPSKARQRLQVRSKPAAVGWGPSRNNDQIRGMAITPAGRLLVSTRDSVLEWDFLRTWSPELHHLYPSGLRSVAQTLLLGASQQAAKRHLEGYLGLWCLPKEVLLRVLSLVAAQPGAWMSGLPAVSHTEGLPPKPLEMKALVELHHNGGRANTAQLFTAVSEARADLPVP